MPSGKGCDVPGPFLVEDSQPLEETRPVSTPAEPARPLNIYELKFLEKASAAVPESLNIPCDQQDMGTRANKEGNGMGEVVEVEGEDTGDQEKKGEIGEKGDGGNTLPTDPEQMRILKSQPADMVCEPALPQHPQHPQHPEPAPSQPSQPDVDGSAHHILDDYAKRVLMRAEQDQLYLERGGKKRGRAKGSGKGKGKGKGRGRGHGKKVEEEPAPPKKRTRKDRLVKTLFPSDDEACKEHHGSEASQAFEPAAEPASASSRKPSARTRAPPRMKRPAAAKRAPRKQAAAAQSSEPAPSPEAPVAEAEAPVAEMPPSAEPKANPAPPRRATAAKSKAKAKATKAKEPKTKMPRKGGRADIPTFASCSIVPYWSRPACGLKVPVRLGRPETDPEHLSTKVTQAFYVGVRGAPMKELVAVIAEVVPQC